MQIRIRNKFDKTNLCISPETLSFPFHGIVSDAKWTIVSERPL